MEWRNWRWIKALPARTASLFAVGASLVAILDRIDPLVAQQVMRDDLPAAMIKAIVIAHGALTFIFYCSPRSYCDSWFVRASVMALPREVTHPMAVPPMTSRPATIQATAIRMTIIVPARMIPALGAEVKYAP